MTRAAQHEVIRTTSRSSWAVLFVMMGTTALAITQHADVWLNVLPVIGGAPGAQRLLAIDAVSLAAWVTVTTAFSMGRFRGDVWIIVLTFAITASARCYHFGLLAAPSVTGHGASVVANRMRLAQLPVEPDGPNNAAALQRAREVVLVEALRVAATAPPLTFRSLLSSAPVVLAPFMVWLGFVAGPWLLSVIRRWRRLILILGAVAIPLSRIAATRGLLHGFTPLEFVLVPVALAMAASLSEQVADIRLGGRETLVAGRETLVMLAIVATGFFPLPIVGVRVAEVGVLSVLCAAVVCSAWACVLRARFLLSTVGLALILVAAAFTLSSRPSERLSNAVNPYPELSTLAPAQRAAVARRNDQIRATDTIVLDGGVLGSGTGRGLAWLVARAGDDVVWAGLAGERGVFGVALLVTLYGLLLWRVGVVALASDRGYERAAVAVLGAIIAVPFVLAWGGAFRLLPLTGVPTAFVAGSGSKLLAAAFSIGIIAQISGQLASRRGPGASTLHLTTGL